MGQHQHPQQQQQASLLVLDDDEDVSSPEGSPVKYGGGGGVMSTVGSDTLSEFVALICKDQSQRSQLQVSCRSYTMKRLTS